MVGAHSFYAVRILLGAAEAGFFPGIIVYFTHWFPYYVIPRAQPDDLERLWLYWGRMMMVSAAAIWLMAAPETPQRLERIESMKAT